MRDLQPGDRVNITVQNAPVSHQANGWLTYTIDGTPHRIPLTAPGITVERGDPAAWPPQEADLWRAQPTGELYFAVDIRDVEETDEPEIIMVLSHENYRISPENLREQCGGDLALVYRENRGTAGDATPAVVQARDLSCQGLQTVNPDQLTHCGVPVEGFHEEMKRRGEGHVYRCELIGHRAVEGKMTALQQQSVRIAALADQLDTNAAADEQSKDDVICELIERHGSWSSQHPEVARLGALAQVQRNIAAKIRSILDPTPEICRCGEPGRTQDQMYQCSAADCVAHDYLATGGDMSLRGTGRYPHPDLTDLRDALADGRREAGEG